MLHPAGAGTRFKGRRSHSLAPPAPAHLPTNPSSTVPTVTASLSILSGQRTTHSLDHLESWPRDPSVVLPGSGQPPQLLSCKTSEGGADTQHGCTENHECLTSNTGCRVSRAAGEVLERIQQLLLMGSCKHRAEAFSSCKATMGCLAIAAPSRRLARNNSVGQQHTRGNGWAVPREALSQGDEKPKSFTWELLRASPVLHAVSADAVTTTEREESNCYTDFPRSQMLFGRPAASHKYYKSTKNPPRSRHLNKGKGRSEREEKGRLFIQMVM